MSMPGVMLVPVQERVRLGTAGISGALALRLLLFGLYGAVRRGDPAPLRLSRRRSTTGDC